jgi:L-asparaginase / beta-aspartyl-peptidase
MKITLTIIFFISFAFTQKYAIALHGGAGVINKSMNENYKKELYKSLEAALKLGQDMLEKGGNGLDVVETVIRFLEDDPKFNAGKGAVYTAKSDHELDASVMSGKDLRYGAIAGVKHIKNPISLARAVMERSEHVLLAGDGAEVFAKEQGFTFVENNYFDTEQRKKQLAIKKASKHGTVGVAVLDKEGNLYAGTSTGGMTNKKYGRIGDAPIIGAGVYANNLTCAISSTGWGEKFLKRMVAVRISNLMEFKNMSLKEAAEQVVLKELDKNDGGIISVDKNGNIAMVFNSIGMYRAAANSDGHKEVKIWE